MMIGLTGAERRDAFYWRQRAEETRQAARLMADRAPRLGMLQIARIYDNLAMRADDAPTPQPLAS
jgi:hypothetical protein